MKNKKVFKFNELMDPEMGMALGLHSFQKDLKDDDYFFDLKEVNKLWDEDVVKIYVYNVRFDGDSLIFKTKITIYEDEFDIYILVDYDENVEFGSEIAAAGAVPTSPANSAKLTRKSPNLFAPGKILISLTYVSQGIEMAHPIPITTQESLVR
jgi:hypothetical protein